MIVLLVCAACVALAALIAAWRAGRGAPVLVGLGSLAAALAVMAWVLGPAALTDTGNAPQPWLVESAQAFSKSPGVSQRAQAGSLPELAERLAARLTASPDDPAGWSLLAATYRQLGREGEAAAAEQHAIALGADPATAGDMHRFSRAASDGSSMLQSLTSGSSAAARFVAEGQRLRIQRKFPEAAEAFRKAVEADPGDADSWADLADAAAYAAGRDLTVSRDAIGKALAINPRHRKALWLQASLELQERQFAQAAQTWRTLATLVEPGSPDARVIAVNISEADSLAAGAGREG